MVLHQRTPSAKAAELGDKWHIISAKGQTLGRMASRIALVLRGKHKATFTPHANCGDHVVVIDAEQLVVTGNKLADKLYYRTNGRPGGLKETTLQTMMQKDPARVIRMAVKGMLPHNRLGREILKKLKVYVGSEHPHEAQQPEPLEL